MRLLQVGLAAVLIPAIAVAQQAGRPEQAGAAISGTVEDTSGFALDAEIAIVALKRRTSTGPDGTFRLTDLKPGRYSVSARRLGYYAQSRTVTVTDTGASVSFVLVPLRFTLPPVVTSAARGGLSGVIGDTSFAVVEGAQIQIVSSNKHQARSDSLGQFFIDAPPGRYMVKVSRAGFGSQLVSVTVPRDSGRRMLVWLKQTDRGLAAREESAIKAMAERIAWGGLGCAADKGRSLCSGRPALITREDMNRWGFKELGQVASSGAMLPVDDFCQVTVGNTGRTYPMWMLSAAEIEALEVYPTRRESYAVTSEMARTGAVSSKPPAFSKDDCPVLYAWVRK